MKQLKHLVLYLPFVLAAVGCSQDELTPDGGTGTGVPEGLHEVEITFNMGTSAGLQTRAIQRPVISSDDWQRVGNVRIYVFKSEAGGDNSSYLYYQPTVNGETVPYLHVEAFDKDDNWGDTDENPYKLTTSVWGDTEKGTGDNYDKTKFEEHIYVQKIGLDANAHYKFLAVGRDDINESDLSTIKMTDPTLPTNLYPQKVQSILEYYSNQTTDPNWEWVLEDGTSLTKACLLNVSANYSNSCAEVFTGYSGEVFISEDVSGFQTTIEMKRAVAGLLMYVKNIPTQVEANLSFVKTTVPKKTYYVQAGITYPVKGIGIVTTRINNILMLASRGIEDDYISAMQDAGNLLQNSPIYLPLNPDDPKETENGVSYYSNSYLEGRFILPLPSPEYDNYSITLEDEDKTVLSETMYLVYYADYNNGQATYPIRTVPIKMKGAGISTYSMDANSFYSFGNRNYLKDEQGDKEGGDTPIDLKPKKDSEENLVITVHPNWEGITELPLE